MENSNHKTEGRSYKRLAAEYMIINPRLVEFLFQPLRELQGFPDQFDIVDDFVNDEDEGAVQLGILGVTVSSVVEAALGRMRGGYGDNWEMDQTATMACTLNCELKKKSTKSEESWSDDEFLESDSESLVDDDCSLVGEGDV